MFFSSCLQNSKFWNSMCSSWNRQFCCICGLWTLLCQPEHPVLGLQRQNLSFQAVQRCTEVRVNLLNLVFLNQWKCQHDHNWRAWAGQAGCWVYACLHQQSTLQHVTAAVTPRVGLNYVRNTWPQYLPRARGNISVAGSGVPFLPVAWLRAAATLTSLVV